MKRINMSFRNLIDFSDIPAKEWEEMCTLAADMKIHPHRYVSACAGKVLATLFYEPSTRTQLSFQTAMFRLGGSVIGFSDPNSSSVSKGETLRDTIKIVSTYADVVAMRNPVEGAAFAASLYCRVPLINAGDGGHLHPTQTMTDMYTIREEKGGCDGLSIGMCGDLLNGRTVHSLSKALSPHFGNTYYLISTDKLKMPGYATEMLSANGGKIIECRSRDECIALLDVLYMTRIQRERFSSESDYRSQAGIFVLDSEKLKKAKDDLIILHPLPKVDEISYEVDDDPRSKYFEQAENALYLRMALILTLTEKFPNRLPVKGEKYIFSGERYCKNPVCISNHEKYLPKIVKQKNERKYCGYCDRDV